MLNKAVFLDRDGVINDTVIKNGMPHPPSSLKDLKLVPKVKDAIQLLKEAGFVLVVVTNQPDVARGSMDIKTVHEINEFIKSTLPIDDILTCFHDDNEGCECRKPRPGNIMKAAEIYNIDIKSSFMIGDRWRDIEAGLNAGCQTIFIDYGYQEKQPKAYSFKVKSFYEAAQLISKLN